MIEEVTKAISEMAPVLVFFIVGAILIRALSELLEIKTSSPFGKNTNLKFWEWGFKKYCVFNFVIVMGSIILNKSLGFIVSIISLAIMVFVIFPNQYKKTRKERAQNE